MKNTQRILALLLSVILCISLLPVASFAEAGDISLIEETGLSENPDDADSNLFEDVEIESEPETEEESVTNAAALAEIVASGICGANLTWALDAEGTLTISGEGEMTNWTSNLNVPWYSSLSAIKTINIEYGVTSIGDYAFFYCYNLSSVTIPASVVSINNFAFQNCSSLTTMTIPENVTSIGYNAFYNCYGLTSVTISDSVRSIGDYAFYDCNSLTNVTLPDSVTSIGEGTFWGCDAITSMTIPASVMSIGDFAFLDCGGLTEINVDSRNLWYSSLNGVLFDKEQTTLITYPARKTDNYYEIPTGVTSILKYAFNNCYVLESMVIPDSVLEINEQAFNWGRLKIINVDPNNQKFSSLDGVLFDKEQNTLVRYPLGKSDAFYELPSGVTSIGDYAFQGCSNLSSVLIPDSVTNIGDYAFYDCSSLESVTLSNRITSIGASAFGYCSNLTSVTLPDNLINIGAGAFNYCSSLTSMIIPDKVTSIGTAAFISCSSLNSVTIGKGTASIGDISFAFCTGLTRVTFQGSAPTLSDNVFTGDTLTACYPDGDASWTPVITQQYGGTIDWVAYTPSQKVPGDVNGDGSMNLKDLLQLKNALANDTVSSLPSWENANMNGDSGVDLQDLLLLKCQLAGC